MSAPKKLVLLMVALTFLIAACTAREVEPPADLQADVGRETRPEVEPGTVDELVAGNNQFAFDLYQAIAGEEGNLFFSPYSISTALAMTYAGAQGETAEQMAGVLHYTLPPAELHPAFNALDLALSEGDEETFALEVANALWGQEAFAFHQEFLNLLATHYGAGMRLVNFTSAAGREAASERINGWVSEATNEKITDLVTPKLFTDLTRLVLTNAIYFNALWEKPFNANLTREAGFTLPDGSRVTVPMMSRRADTAYAAGEGWQAAELAYGEGRASMLILLPAEDQFESFAENLDADRLEEILAALEPTDLKLYLPRFEYEAELMLAETLAEMGMPLAFLQSADFSGMAEIPPNLYLGHVVHKAYVATDELGTEAAAATAVIVEIESMPEEMRVDRPFLFLIRDTEQETILFLGRVVNPVAS